MFWLLVPVAGLGLLAWLSNRRRKARLERFAETRLVERLMRGVDPRRRAVRGSLHMLGLVLLVGALAGPRWGFQWEEVRREGIDLLVALDTSRSMLATDVKPNRLERAKLAVLDMVKLLRGDRIGLVAFAGTAFLECPLTLDYAAFERSLRAVDVGIIPRGGTAIARAIDVALDGFEARQGKHEALILITDGENHEGDVEEAAKRAAERGVKIYAVGIGTAEGELIPVTTEDGQTFVKDRQGRVVKSRLDEETLKKIAAASGGAYVRGLGPALGLDEVFRDYIAKMERRDVASTLERRYEERFQLPLVLALLCLVVEMVLADRREAQRRTWLGVLSTWAKRRRRRSAGRTTPGSITALLLCFALPLPGGWFDRPGDRAAEGTRLYEQGKYADAAAKFGEGMVDEPESPLLRFNLGAALYKQGKYAEASAEWSKLLATSDPGWTAKAAYNLGNAQYHLGANAEQDDPQAAIASYEQALLAYRRAMSADPTNPDPKFNHEFVARKIEQLKKRLEEEKKRQEEQQQEEPQEGQEEQPPQEEKQPPPEQQPSGEPGAEEQQQTEQAAPGEEQEKEESHQEQEEELPAEGGGSEQRQSPPQVAAEAGQGEDQEGADERAARAILDTARGEELGPEDVRRPLGVAVPGEPLQDW